MKTFLVSYAHGGQRWSERIKARDFDDAQERLSRMAFATVDGEFQFEVHAALGPIAKAYVWLRNALAGRA